MANIGEVSGGVGVISSTIRESIKEYFARLKGEEAIDLYQLVLEEVEMPLFQVVMEHCKYNQSKAASILGISRGTLRAKLRQYFDDKYVGIRE